MPNCPNSSQPRRCLVIGNRDMEANAVSLRNHGKGNVDAKPPMDYGQIRFNTAASRKPPRARLRFTTPFAQVS